MKFIRYSALLVALTFGASSAMGATGLMIPDSGAGDRVMLFSDFDGSLIDLNWITDIGAVGWFFTTPKEAITVGNEIWVTDQVADAIHRFDLNRNFLSSITAHPNGGVLDNIRGLDVDGSKVYVTVFHTTSANRGLATYNYAGAPGGFFQNNGSFFDVAPFGNELLISNSTTNDIERYTPAGAFLGIFAINRDFPQQLEVLPDNSVLTVSSIASIGVEGVWHYESDGSLRRYIDTQDIKDAFGELVPRGAWVLGDGNYLISTSIGVFKYFVGTDTFTRIVGGVDAQYINYVPEPATISLLAAAGLIALRRRR